MLRKHALLYAPEIADAPTGGATNLTAANRGPVSSSWIKKLPSLAPQPDKPAADAAPAAPKKEDDNGQKSAATGSDKDKSADAAGVDPDPHADLAAAALAATEKEEEAKKAAAATKTKEKPADKKADDTDEDEKRPVDAKDWEKFKARRKEREAALRSEIEAKEKAAAELQAKLAELEQKATTADPATAEKLARQEALIKQFEARLAELDVTKDPRFEDYFKEKTQAAHETINAIVGPDSGKKFIELLSLPDGDYKTAQLNDFYAALDDVQKSELGAARMELRAIDRERAAEIKKAMDSKSKLQEERKSKAEAYQKEFEKEFTTQLKALQDPKNGFSVFQKREGNDENTKRWNATVDERIEQVKGYLMGKDTTPKAIVNAALDAASAKVFRNIYASESKKWKAEKAKLEATIKELTAAQPSAGRGEGAEKDRRENTVLKTGVAPIERTRNWTRSIIDAMQPK